MTNLRPSRLAAACAVIVVIMLGVALSRPLAQALPGGTAPSGTLHMTPSTGDSSTTWALAFDQPNSYCAGDGVAGYRWHTFITSIANDPATLTFMGSGSPVSTGGGITLPLRLTNGVMVRAQTPTPVNGTEGFINLSLNFNFSSPAYGQLVAGDYWLGIACTAESQVGENVEYWSMALTIADAEGAGPNNFTFAPAATAATTTTTSTVAATTTTSTVAATTTTATPTTTTTPATGSTTTSSTVAGGSTTTSTTVGGAATTTTTTAGTGSTPTSTTTTAIVGGVTTSSTVSPFGAVPPTPTPTPTPQLAATGSSSWTLVAWAVGLLVLGRIAILIGRTPKVIPSDRR